MKKRVPVKEAAERLGMDADIVRYYMRRNLFNPPIGQALPCKGSRKRHNYIITAERLDAYLEGRGVRA